MSNDNITHVDFAKEKLEADPDIVSRLEYMLALAKEGRIVAIGVAAVSNAETSYTAFINGSCRHSLLGTVAYLQHRMLSELEREPSMVPHQVKAPPTADESDPVPIDIGRYAKDKASTVEQNPDEGA